MNEYKVTILIESDEEMDSIEFWTKADSLEEAVENIRSDLDV